MRTAPCNNSTDFLQEIAELQQEKELPQPQEVKLFLENNQRWLNELSQNPDLGSKLAELAERIEKIETGEKVVSSFIRHIAEDMRFPDELAGRIMQMTVGDSITANRIAESSSLGRSEMLRAKAEKINRDKEWPSLIGEGTPEQAVAFICSLGPHLQYLNLTKIEVTSTQLAAIAEACPNITECTCDSSQLDSEVTKALAKWKKLEVLDLRWSGIEEVSLCDMPAMRECYLGGQDSHLKSFSLENAPSCTFLNIESSSVLEKITLKNLEQLAEIAGYSCGELVDVEFGEGLGALEAINFPDCDSLLAVDFSLVTGVKKLYLSGCDSLQSLDVSSLTNLQELDISSTKIISVLGLENAINFQSLWAKGNDMLEQQFFEKFQNKLKS